MAAEDSHFPYDIWPLQVAYVLVDGLKPVLMGNTNWTWVINNNEKRR